MTRPLTHAQTRQTQQKQQSFLGAPSLACASLQPFHGLHRPKPASASQFFVSQSSLTYSPGSNVSVEITTHSDGRHFRGFIVQAYNSISGERIGEFVAGEHAQPMASCSAATHKDSGHKKSVQLVWLAPGSNQVASAQPPQQPDGQPTPALTAFGRQWLGLQKRSNLPGANSKAAAGQVRFRATVVVSYAEFYTGFESSELHFERFNYSQAATSGALEEVPLNGAVRAG